MSFTKTQLELQCNYFCFSGICLLVRLLNYFLFIVLELVSIFTQFIKLRDAELIPARLGAGNTKF